MPLRALIVDDSAVAREVLTLALREDPAIDVVTAPNATIAGDKIRQQRPDVVVLDIELPGVNGLAFLERLMAEEPIPVVVCSSVAQPGAMAAVRALELGAVEVIEKPCLNSVAMFVSGGRFLHEIVRDAAGARVRRTTHTLATPTKQVASALPSDCPPWHGPVIVIGASTGGTDAIRTVLSALPHDAPPTVIVQHMPAAFTSAFANRMNAFTAMDVREARDGDALRPGLALIAPGGRQIEIARRATTHIVRVFDGNPVSGHRPSVDVLFRSAAKMLGRRAVGALLTGMGADGAEGLLRMRAQGAHTIAQNERTCVVFGMPKEAIVRGGAVDVLPLDQIGAMALHASKRIGLSTSARASDRG
jgi:two-component system chemotaxis response regulator CheB